jgi:AraC-like DNA-binding protein
MTRYANDYLTIKMRVRQFFEQNPHEELSVEDMCTKFECSVDTIQAAIKEMKDAGFLRRSIIYRRTEAA